MTTTQAKEFLKSQGYFVDNLYSVQDVQEKFHCDDDTAQDILYWVFEDEFVCDAIQSKINQIGSDEQLKEKS
jgi:hypothetical protein